MHKNFIKIFLLLAMFLAVPKTSHAGIIFQENFDSTQDWNASGEYEGSECSPLGIAASNFTCTASKYPPNWDAFRAQPGFASHPPTISIQRPPDNIDHTAGAGKAAVIWQESEQDGVNMPGDGILLKKLSQDYDELYVQVWIKSNPSWKFGDNGFMKTIRVYHRGYTVGNWFDFFTVGQRPAPSWILDPKYAPDTGWRHVDSLRGVPDDGSSAFLNVCQDTSVYNGRVVCLYSTQYIEDPWAHDVAHGGAPIPGITWTTPGQLLDGGWHKLTVRLKMNTKTGSTWNDNGIYQMWLDDVLLVNASALRWISSGNAVGWNGFAIGGNASNQFNGQTPSHQWYVMDDVVVSTTPITNVSDITAPAAPTGLSVM